MEFRVLVIQDSSSHNTSLNEREEERDELMRTKCHIQRQAFLVFQSCAHENKNEVLELLGKIKTTNAFMLAAAGENTQIPVGKVKE